MKFPTPGNKVDISVWIYIPDSMPPQDFISQYVMWLYNVKYKCFGEPLVATIQMDRANYDIEKGKALKNLELDSIDRVSDYPDEVSMHKAAYDNHLKGNGSFKDCLEALQKKVVKRVQI